jgi:uncharacterized delta-60 repeat protein
MRVPNEPSLIDSSSGGGPRCASSGAREGTRACGKRPFFLVILVCLLIASATPALATPGHRDPTFGGDGKVLTRFEGGGAAFDMAIQPDAKVVAVGRAGSPDVDWALARYKLDGKLDPTFGGDGRVTTHFTRKFEFTPGVAVQANGKILAVGSLDAKFIVARYRSNGVLDPAFGGDGTVLTKFGGVEAGATATAIQPDGKIVALGIAESLTCCPHTAEFALARYNLDGTLDTTFSGNGKVTTALSGKYDFAEDLAIPPDGKIVAVGTGTGQFEIARYNADGTLDATFDGDGFAFTDFTVGDDSAGAVAIQPDGKIVAAGDAGGPGEYTSAFGLARYNADGTLDTGFDGDGMVVTDFTVEDDGASGVAIQTDGRIVAGGSAGFNGIEASFALARYNADGTLDTTFSDDGMVKTSFTAGFDSARGMGIQSDGKIVLAGSAGAVTLKFALARYLG